LATMSESILVAAPIAPLSAMPLMPDCLPTVSSINADISAIAASALVETSKSLSEVMFYILSEMRKDRRSTLHLSGRTVILLKKRCNPSSTETENHISHCNHNSHKAYI